MKAAGSKSSGRPVPVKAADESLDIDRTFAFRMVRLVNLLGKRYQVAYERKYDLTLTEWRILSVIAAQPGASAIDVCNRTGYGEMLVSRAVRRLEEGGRLARTTSAADRRRAMLELTRKGWDVYRKIIPHYVSTEEMLIRSLTAAERQKLDELLERMIKDVLQMPGLESSNGRAARKAAISSRATG
jgi:DNA-binding MarR family transcriptional regulator